MAAELTSAGKNELRRRVISAAVLAPVVLAAIFVGGLPFAAIIALAAAISFWEWTAIGRAEEPMWVRAGAVVCLVAGLIAMAWGIPAGAAIIALPAIAGVLAGLAKPSLRWMGLGLAYVGIPCAGLILLRSGQPFGLAAILFILAVVWATDIAAFFGGRALGGPKLWPRVSPKKTWSGAISGLLAAMVASGLVVGALEAGDMVAALLLAIPLSIAAQAGDLLESSVKRHFGVKDSGSIIPGHGGVLDRVDGLFGAAALAWLIAALGIAGAPLLLPAAIVPVTGGAS